VDVDAGEGEGELEAIPGGEGEGVLVAELEGLDAVAGELGEFDDAGLELVVGAAGAVRGDGDVMALAEVICHEDEGGASLVGFGAGAACGVEVELGADVGYDLAVFGGAGEDGALALGKEVTVEPGDEEHLVMPEGPDLGGVVGVCELGVVTVDFQFDGGDDETHEACDGAFWMGDADFGHGFRR
jgi:hypothetical protein